MLTYFTFPDGGLRYDCAACRQRCCRGKGFALGGEELIALIGRVPKLAAHVGVRAGGTFAAVDLTDGCWFLAKDGNCAIEVEHGRSSKPSTCRLFPFNRVFRVGDVRVVDVNSVLCPVEAAAGAGGVRWAELEREIEELAAPEAGLGSALIDTPAHAPPELGADWLEVERRATSAAKEHAADPDALFAAMENSQGSYNTVHQNDPAPNQDSVHQNAPAPNQDSVHQNAPAPNQATVRPNALAPNQATVHAVHQNDPAKNKTLNEVPSTAGAGAGTGARAATVAAWARVYGVDASELRALERSVAPRVALLSPSLRWNTLFRKQAAPWPRAVALLPSRLRALNFLSALAARALGEPPSLRGISELWQSQSDAIEVLARWSEPVRLGAAGFGADVPAPLHGALGRLLGGAFRGGRTLGELVEAAAESLAAEARPLAVALAASQLATLLPP